MLLLKNKHNDECGIGKNDTCIPTNNCGVNHDGWV